MYHYIMNKKILCTVFTGIFGWFFFVFCFTNGYCALSSNDAPVFASTQSPREKWNYNKKEDKIDHHKRTVNTKHKKTKKENPAHKDSETAGNSVNNDADTLHNVPDQDVENVYRPGSPRDRW